MRIRSFTTAGFALAALLAIVAPAHAGDSTGPACTDITDGTTLLYSTLPIHVTDPIVVDVPRSTPIVEGTIVLEAASCADVQYQVTVYDDVTQSVVLGQSKQFGNGWVDSSGQGVLVVGAIPITVPWPSVCAVIETMNTAGSSVYDQAPNAPLKCVSLSLNGPPGYIFH